MQIFTRIDNAIEIIYTILSSEDTTQEEPLDPLTIHLLIVFEQRLLHCKHKLEKIVQRNEEPTTRPPATACPAYGVSDEEGKSFPLNSIEQVFNSEIYINFELNIPQYEAVECKFDPKLGIIFEYKRKTNPQQTQIAES